MVREPTTTAEYPGALQTELPIPHEERDIAQLAERMPGSSFIALCMQQVSLIGITLASNCLCITAKYLNWALLHVVHL